MIFEKQTCPIVYINPREFLVLILCQFWHPHSLSYQRNQTLFDSLKVPHQVVAVVIDMVWTRELASSFTDKCLLIILKKILTGQHNEINLRPIRKSRQLSISSLQITI